MEYSECIFITNVYLCFERENCFPIFNDDSDISVDFFNLKQSLIHDLTTPSLLHALEELCINFKQIQNRIHRLPDDESTFCFEKDNSGQARQRISEQNALILLL